MRGIPTHNIPGRVVRIFNVQIDPKDAAICIVALIRKPRCLFCRPKVESGIAFLKGDEIEVIRAVIHSNRIAVFIHY